MRWPTQPSTGSMPVQPSLPRSATGCCNAADAYGHAVRARAEWRAKVRMKPKAGGWPT